MIQEVDAVYEHGMLRPFQVFAGEQEVACMHPIRQSSLVLLIVAFLFSGQVHAMTFPEFDHMAAQDRQDYLDFLVESAQKVLIDQGHKDVAAKVYQLFHEIHPGSQLPLGEAEFEMNLDNARVRAAEKAIQNPKAPRVQVETALVSTLGKNGVEITRDFVRAFVQLAATFKPRFSPENKK